MHKNLRRIKKNLLAGFYKNAQEFATDFRQMISETYRYCIDKDPIIEQAQQLHHQFEMAFAKRIQAVTEPEVETEEEPMVVQDAEMDETEILQNILSVGRATSLKWLLQNEYRLLRSRKWRQKRNLWSFKMPKWTKQKFFKIFFQLAEPWRLS